jgi:predicted lipoprotein with Yx(FWY)xxD motif
MKEFPDLHALALVCIDVASVSSQASSAANVAANNGMTLCVFDKDKNGVPTCYDEGAKQWPPYLSASGEEGRGPGHSETKRWVAAMDLS